MKNIGIFLAFLIATSMVAPAAAQGLNAGRIEGSLNPLVALIEGVTRIGWTMTKLFVGMDDASISYFTYQLGFRKDEVLMDVNTLLSGETNCTIGSFRSWEDGSLACSDIEGTAYNVSDGTNKVNVTLLEDTNKDGKIDQTDVFKYLISKNKGDLYISNGAKGQVMLFALLIPLGMLWFLLTDFFASTGMLRMVTSQILSLGIALIAARSGVYTALLSMISDIFGAGGFFMSMFSIYLILAVLLWFYGGFRRGKKIAESEEMVANAVVQGFSHDLRRGLMGEQAANELAKKEK